jgi:hypothetical protein
VPSLIFAFCSSVSLILTSFAILSSSLSGGAISQRGGQLCRAFASTISHFIPKV